MKGYTTKRITLPGGKVIEIVYFHDGTAPQTGESGTSDDTAALATGLSATAIQEADAPAPATGAPGLHQCTGCGSSLVYPVAWEERGEDRWLIERRCPNCEWREAGDFGQDEVEAFDDILNEGTELLLGTLRDMARSNMAEDVERLVRAIDTGLIQPIDF